MAPLSYGLMGTQIDIPVLSLLLWVARPVESLLEAEVVEEGDRQSPSLEAAEAEGVEGVEEQALFNLVVAGTYNKDRMFLCSVQTAS